MERRIKLELALCSCFSAACGERIGYERRCYKDGSDGHAVQVRRGWTDRPVDSVLAVPARSISRFPAFFQRVSCRVLPCRPYPNFTQSGPFKESERRGGALVVEFSFLFLHCMVADPSTGHPSWKIGRAHV